MFSRKIKKRKGESPFSSSRNANFKISLIGNCSVYAFKVNKKAVHSNYLPFVIFSLIRKTKMKKKCPHQKCLCHQV